MKRNRLGLIGLLGCLGLVALFEAFSVVTAVAQEQADIRITSFRPEPPVFRAKRPTAIAAGLDSTVTAAVMVQPRLVVPTSVRIISGPTSPSLRLEGSAQRKLNWTIAADTPGPHEVRLEILRDGATLTSAALTLPFLPAVEQRRLSYIPEPRPLRKPLLVGAHHCPLWEAAKPDMWNNVLKHPERTPALGFYSQENPEVADWETKWAVEHGIDFYVYCWYRTSQGGPVTMQYSSAIHDALFRSRFVNAMKFTIMWENQWRGHAGVADENDLLTNLLPFWIENYFKHPSYLKIDNKPLLFIYRPEFLVDDLGGVENVARALDKMRAACRAAGFAGLTILGEYRGLDPKHLTLMKRLGLEYTFAYCWGIPNSPGPEQAIAIQMDKIRQTQRLGILPQVVTVSQAWSGWRDEGSIWKIPPRQFESLLAQARDFIATLPPGQLGSRMLLLDNWNEWGEGHYIAPYREYGFGYLDAVRKVLAGDATPHEDLIPEDIGLGPYDAAYKAQRP